MTPMATTDNSKSIPRQVQLDRTSLALVFALGLAVGLGFGFFALARLPGQCTDVDGFGALGARFALDWGFGGSLRRAPVYPVFLGLLYRAFGIGNHAAVVSAQAIVSGLLCLSVQWITFSWFRSARLAFWTGLGAAIHPMFWWYVPRLWVELLYALLTLWGVQAAIRAAERPTAGRLVVFGAFSALASLCKATSLLHPLFIGLAVMLERFLRAGPFARVAWKDVARFVFVPTLAMCVFLAPWTWRNWRVSGRFVPVSGHLPVEFFRGTALADQNSFLLRQGIAELWTEAIAREQALMDGNNLGANGVRAEMAKDDLFAKPMKSLMFGQPWRFALKTLKQIPTFWTLGETRGKSMFFLVNATILLALAGWGGWQRRRQMATAVVFWTIVYFNLCYAAILAYARYSMVLYPLLLPYAGYGIALLCRPLCERGWILQKRSNVP